MWDPLFPADSSYITQPLSFFWPSRPDYFEFPACLLLLSLPYHISRALHDMTWRCNLPSLISLSPPCILCATHNHAHVQSFLFSFKHMCYSKEEQKKRGYMRHRLHVSLYMYMYVYSVQLISYDLPPTFLEGKRNGDYGVRTAYHAYYITVPYRVRSVVPYARNHFERGIAGIRWEMITYVRFNLLCMIPSASRSSFWLLLWWDGMCGCYRWRILWKGGWGFGLARYLHVRGERAHVVGMEKSLGFFLLLLLLLLLPA